MVPCNHIASGSFFGFVFALYQFFLVQIFLIHLFFIKYIGVTCFFLLSSSIPLHSITKFIYFPVLRSFYNDWFEIIMKNAAKNISYKNICEDLDCTFYWVDTLGKQGLTGKMLHVQFYRKQLYCFSKWLHYLAVPSAM